MEIKFLGQPQTLEQETQPYRELQPTRGFFKSKLSHLFEHTNSSLKQPCLGLKFSTNQYTSSS